MKLRIVHEPWSIPDSYFIEAQWGLAEQPFQQNSMIGPVWRTLARFESEESARRYAEAYLRGSKVIAEYDSAPAEAASAPQEGLG